MKEIKQCSIAQTAFTLELDAYQTLFNYIENIKRRYDNNPDGIEIIADIEARVAELILATHSNQRVVAKPLIDNIIAQLGSVDDICGEQQQETTTPPPPPVSHSRRLYRDEENKAIGGVCAGIAAYIGCSAAIVRLVALALLICGGVSFWVYVILWIVVPAALTARQKLEMRGEPVTVETIKEFYGSLTNNVTSKSSSIINNIMILIGRILSIFIKFIAAIILIASMLGLVACIVGCAAVVLTIAELNIKLISIAALISMVIMLGATIYTLYKFLTNGKAGVKVLIILLLAWFVSIACVWFLYVVFALDFCAWPFMCGA